MAILAILTIMETDQVEPTKPWEYAVTSPSSTSPRPCCGSIATISTAFRPTSRKA